MTKISGYTLFELLIVLLIIGLLVGMLTPRLASLYDSVQAAYSRDEILNRLSALSHSAFQRGKGFSLEQFPDEPEESTGNARQIEPLPKPDIPLELPEGWKITAHKPIQFLANGACNGGKATLKYYEQIYKVEFIPPFCQLKLL
ncbi:MAG: prepilin-type N-terminal cleavage/methylation domain-containing protein [Pseudomonadota bacterium]